MDSSILTLRDFGTRSRVVYGLMAASFLCALGSAFLLSGQVAIVSFVAFLNFTAGLWIAQLVHSLGHTIAGEPGIDEAERVETTAGLFEEITWERFIRIAAVVAAAATVFVFTASEILSPTVSVIAVGAIGAIALLTAMIAFVIAAASTLDHEGRATVPQVPGVARDGNEDEATATGEEQ